MSPQEQQPLVIGVETSLLPSSVWVAEANGYFQKYGLEVEVKEFNSGKASLVAMLEGDQGIEISAAAPTPIMFNSFEHDDFHYVATFASSNKDIKVTARRDSDILTHEDLAGKKIGTTMGTTGQYITDALLTFKNIPFSEVEILDFPPPELPLALERGEIDAMIIWEPHGSTADELLGSNTLKLSTSEVYTTTFNFLATKELTEQNPEKIEKFLRAIDEATTFIEKNKQKAQEITAQRLGLEIHQVTKHWDDFEFNLAMDDAWLKNIENEAIWAVNNELVDQTEIPNYEEYIYSSALQEVNPEAVTILSEAKSAITIADASQHVFALLYVAENQGYLEREGVEVIYHKFTSGKEALDDVISNRADLATVYETPVVLQSYAGHDLRIISGLHTSSENTGIVALKASGIETAQDFRQKRIAVKKGSNAEYLLFSFLEEQGISIDEVTLVDTKPPEMDDKLTSGEVDAVVVWNPYLFNIKRAHSADEITIFSSNTYTEYSFLVGKKEFVEENQEVVEKLYRALESAEEFLQTNDREAQQITIDWLEGQIATTIRANWDSSQRSLEVREDVPRVLKKQGDWFKSQQLVSGDDPNFEELIYRIPSSDAE